MFVCMSVLGSVCLGVWVWRGGKVKHGEDWVREVQDDLLSPSIYLPIA